jgi:methanol--5-hydroxybenzimidazolylcobamide Co-methyltransferase
MAPGTYSSLSVTCADALLYGVAPRPVACGFDLVIGGGAVFPEVNFTLPAITISQANWPEILKHYEEMATAILKRAVSLQVPGIVLEFELLPAMTDRPEWGAEITALLRRHLEKAHARHGLKSALRVTPTDIRDQAKPPELRGGPAWDRLRRSCDLCIAAGADILSIESVGGKEVHDQALMYGDVRGCIFALGVLAPTDTGWLWDRMAASCQGTRCVPGGDSACGFANTAMQLAHQKMLPEVLAAVIRAASAVRSLAAFEHGAVGPSKDCAYEGPVIKAITGCPISMEGKSAACAHFSPIGNIAAAVCDLWSNESVQNVRLLSGNAPEAFAELLAYDCRLMNTAAARGGAKSMRDWLSASDADLSPQAAVLTPSATIQIAKAIVETSGTLRRTVAAAQTATQIIRGANKQDGLRLSAKESTWLDRIERELAEIPDDEEALLDWAQTAYPGVFRPESYGLVSVLA